MPFFSRPFRWTEVTLTVVIHGACRCSPLTVSSDVQDVGLRHTFTTTEYDDSKHEENVRNHRPVKSSCMITDSNTKQATIQCIGLWCHFVKMSKTDESTHSFTVVMFLHPQVLYISFLSFITNIYKDNYDSLGINEQLSTSGLEMLKPV